MAKADLRKAEADAMRVRVGRALERAVQRRGWTLKEFAGEVEKDQRQCSRWFTGEERPQFDVLFAIESFRQPLVVALAELAGHAVEIETTIRVRQVA